MHRLRTVLIAVAFIAAPAFAETAHEIVEEVEAFPDPVQRLANFDQRILARHNLERSRLNIASLAWNPTLAAEARVWAQELARTNRFEHSRNHGTDGENLWMGTAGAFQPEEMIDFFIDERREFVPGKFPGVSRTGKWQDVGHYTQLIWRETREVGCATAQGRTDEVLVCRYRPGGNMIGKRVP